MKQQKTMDTNTNQEAIEKKRGLRPAAAGLALALLAAACGGFFYYRNYAAASTISLDVNPGIELKIKLSASRFSPAPPLTRMRRPSSFAWTAAVI